MTSESQERMLAIVEPERPRRGRSPSARRWEVRATVVGAGHRRRPRCACSTASTARCSADVPAASLHDAAPLVRPAPGGARPTWRAPTPRPSPPPRQPTTRRRPARHARRHRRGSSASTTTSCSSTRSWARAATPPCCGSRHPVTGRDTGRGWRSRTDGNHRWCAVDPRRGTALVVAEAVLNLACVGARPLAVVNCLNFGNPEHPEVMWQLSEAIDGMAEACRALGVPVVGGNVSLYNESRGRDIDPTPCRRHAGAGRPARAAPARHGPGRGRRAAPAG